MELKKNMGTADRVIRLAVAAIISALYFSHVVSGLAAIVLLVAAGIFALTSMVGFCPLYRVFKISTLFKRS